MRRSTEGGDAPPIRLHRGRGPGWGCLAARELAGHHAHARQHRVNVSVARLGTETITGRGCGVEVAGLMTGRPPRGARAEVNADQQRAGGGRHTGLNITEQVNLVLPCPEGAELLARR